ncbi:MAG: FMN-binding protein [Candidatus Dormibacteraeota bacterium]|nr:FMN-binding protein [Candidatus Dormibacteraeota bacterium]
MISFRTPPSSAVGTGASLPAQPSPSPSADSSTPSGGPPAGPTPPAPTPSPRSTGLKSGTFTGTDYPNQFGDVQVRITVSGGKITDVTALQYPTDRARSALISQQAIPLLREEVLQAQTANIDILGGATFTTESYAESVQSALDQAHA